jgi:hypothetical protein
MVGVIFLEWVGMYSLSTCHSRTPRKVISHHYEGRLYMPGNVRWKHILVHGRHANDKVILGDVYHL